MSWDDWVFGICTLGVYNLAKTAYKAGEAADQAGDAVEEIADSIGKSAAVIAETMTKLADELGSFIHELEQQMTIKRLTPRSEDELWDEEVERLAALRTMEAELVAQLEALGAEDDGSFSWSDIFENLERTIEELFIRVKLVVVRNAIHEILYEEPGVVPETIHQVKGILERFHTLEQPRIEAMMDTAEDSMEEFREILVEVKKLFVVTRWQEIDISALSEPVRRDLEQLKAKRAIYDELIAKNSAVAVALHRGLNNIQPSTVHIPNVDTGGGTAISRSRPVTGQQKGQGMSMAKLAGMTVQPMSDKIGSRIKNTDVAAYLGSYNSITGRIRFFERERLKIEKAIERIRWVKIEEPGVIPKTLEEIHLSIQRFRTEEQPRIEKIMDNINESIEKTRRWFDFLTTYRTPILLALGCVGVLSVAIMVMVLLVLIKIALS